MDTSLLSILPNLSIGVVSVVALVYTVLQFLKALDSQAKRHEQAIAERETSLRDVESHVRNMLASSLTQASIALEQNTRVLTRIISKLDNEK
jgi:hypothetical protein